MFGPVGIVDGFRVFFRRGAGFNDWTGVIGLSKGFIGIKIEALCIRVGPSRAS